MNIQSLFSTCQALALTSEGTQRNGRTKIGAILFDKKGRIHAAKTNSYKTHPYLKRYYAFPHLHAEANAILAQGIEHCEGLNLMVVRMRSDTRGNSLCSMAMPCDSCRKFINAVKIHSIWYTDWNGKLQYPY